MVATPSKAMSCITANVFYDDVAGALDFVAKAFGFEIRASIPGPEGGIIHAEMQLHEGVVMFSPAGDSEIWSSPQSLGGRVTQGLYVYVEGLDAHCERARKAGSEIVVEPEDMFWGDRTYVARDPEGHRWTFAQPVAK